MQNVLPIKQLHKWSPEIVLEDCQLIETVWEHGTEYSLCVAACEPFNEYKIMLAVAEHYMSEQCVVWYTGC